MKGRALAAMAGVLALSTGTAGPVAHAGLTCAQIAASEPQGGHTEPPPAPVMFASDFPALTDCEWGFPLGGWGGIQKGATRQHVPVIFVHGNQADAENWFAVADQFKTAEYNPSGTIVDPGFTLQEMYALSYNGLENAYAGLPARSAPSPESQAYFEANSNAFANGGHGAADDVNVPDLYAFVQAVQAYTGSAYVDIVAHSLGVTITRKMMQDYPQLYNQVLAAVMIAGANHGTTVCRQPAPQYYYGCDEIGPGQPWLDSLNATGESPGPTCWMTVYDGLEGDPFYVGPDEQSPHLRGAYNTQWPMYYHNDLRVDPHIVPAYRDFVETYGQPGHASCPVQD